jgi:ribosome-binding protein aMBF1 (putative translation factor)
MECSEFVQIDLKTVYLRLGWTRQQLACEMGVPVSDLLRWIMQKKCPRTIYNAKICRLLEILDERANRIAASPVLDQGLDSDSLTQAQFSELVRTKRAV